jgi:hypothetical protein
MLNKQSVTALIKNRYANYYKKQMLEYFFQLL